MADYDKVGLFTVRDGRVLLCRKKHTTSLLILPGGCREAGETSVGCLLRELHEELGDVQVEALELLGTYSDRAAGDESRTVQVELYAGNLIGEPHAQSEIRELVWFGAGDSWDLLAPSIRNRIFPDLAVRGLLPFAG
jgi:8-oxo-dGTP diphosphatase